MTTILTQGGTLQSMVRQEAMQKVIDIGGLCSNSVTEQTNFLVMGIQDFRRFNDGQKSTKFKKTELLIAKGYDLEIIDEEDFLKMLYYASVT